MLGRCSADGREYECRSDEIEAWLRNRGPEVIGIEIGPGKGVLPPRYVILDDRPTAARPGTPLADRFVQTDHRAGLTEDDVDAAIALLLPPPPSPPSPPAVSERWEMREKAETSRGGEMKEGR